MIGFEAVPIAFVHNSVKQPRPDRWIDVESRITMAEWVESNALDGLDGFSHVIVVFWLHALGADRPRPMTLIVGDNPVPRGILATRSQLRPTPVGCSVVRLINVAERSLSVRGLDAIDGSPVLDIKPYIPEYDSVAGAAVPAWVYGTR